MLFAVRHTLVEKARWPVGIVLAVTPWVVYLQFLPFTTWSLASERFLFVSVGGLAIVLVDLLGVLAQPRRISALLLLITVPMAMVTWHRVAEWEFGYLLHAREYEPSVSRASTTPFAIRCSTTCYPSGNMQKRRRWRRTFLVTTRRRRWSPLFAPSTLSG